MYFPRALAGAIGEVSEWDAMRSPSKSIPRTSLCTDGERPFSANASGV